MRRRAAVNHVNLTTVQRLCVGISLAGYMVLLATVALLTAGGVRAAAADPRPTVAVLGLEVVDNGGGIDAATTQFAKGLTDVLRSRPKANIGPYGLAPGSERELIDLKAIIGCDTEARECMLKIAKDVGTELLVYGRVERSKAGYQVTLKLLSVRERQVIRTVSEAVVMEASVGSAMQETGKLLYGKVVGGSNAIVVESNISDGQVFLDGEPQGRLQRGRLEIGKLSEGRYRLEIKAAGQTRHSSTIDVRGNGPLTVSANEGGPGGLLLQEGTVSQADSRGVWKGVFYGGVLIAAAGGATLGGAYMRMRDTSRLAPPGATQPYTNSDCSKTDAALMAEKGGDIANSEFRDACRWVSLTWVGGVSLGIGVAAAAVGYYMGYVRAPKTEGTAQRALRRGELVVMPVVGRQGGGAVLELHF